MRPLAQQRIADDVPAAAGTPRNYPASSFSATVIARSELFWSICATQASDGSKGTQLCGRWANRPVTPLCSQTLLRSLRVYGVNTAAKNTCGIVTANVLHSPHAASRRRGSGTVCRARQMSFRGTPRNLAGPLGVPRGDNANCTTTVGVRSLTIRPTRPPIAHFRAIRRALSLRAP